MDLQSSQEDHSKNIRFNDSPFQFPMIFVESYIGAAARIGITSGKTAQTQIRQNWLDGQIQIAELKIRPQERSMVSTIDGNYRELSQLWIGTGGKKRDKDGGRKYNFGEKTNRNGRELEIWDLEKKGQLMEITELSESVNWQNWKKT